MSSSSEEDLSKFSEAADVKLFNNSLYSENKDIGESKDDSSAKTSLRYLDAPEENRTDLRVTPGFQKHVATKLMKILDSALDTGSSTPETKCKSEPDPDGNSGESTSVKPEPTSGVKLFGASAAFLASCNITPPPPTKRRKRGRAYFMSSESEDDSSNNETDRCNQRGCDIIDESRKLGVRDEAELSEKFAACAVTPEWILSGESVKGWVAPLKKKVTIEGHCTPEVWDFISRITTSKQNRTRKKKKVRKLLDEPATIDTVIQKTENLSLQRRKEEKRRRGKRGGKPRGRKKESKQLDNTSETQDSLSVSQVELEKKKKKKEKKKKISKLLLDRCEEYKALERLKKYKKKQLRKKAEKESLQGNWEDEGFDSEPGKTQKIPKIPTKEDFKDDLLLLARIKHSMRKKKKLFAKTWNNAMEGLPDGLENLTMANVKGD